MQRRTAALASILALLCGGMIAACGDDDDATIFAPLDGGDGARDAGSRPDTGGGIDAGQDAQVDAPSTCGAENAACDSNGTKGLCKGGICSACADPADDDACKTAHGGSIDGGAAICNKGACTPGDCHTNANCTGGQICGLTAPNTCGKCSTDTECKTAYGQDFVCNVTTGGCIANTSACQNADAGACVGSPNSICCGTCAPGNCCTDAQCTEPGKNKCVNRVCTGCAPVTNGQYFVDPTVADDSAATGGPTCPFKTITRALAIIGTTQPSAVTVNVKANTTLGPNEIFPLIVPVNVTIKGDAAQPATVRVAPGKVGFVLASASSGLDHLVVDGQAHGATTGIVAQTGASKDTTTIAHVTIKDMGADGILVGNAAGQTAGGGLKVGPAVVVTGSGTTTARANGILVRDNGAVVISGAASPNQTRLDSNTDTGIKVLGAGQITLTGALGAAPPSTGTVTANANHNGGVWIAQTPGTPPANTLTGLTAWNSPAGSGLRIFAGSSVKVRGSSFLGNFLHGVHVPSFTGATVNNNVLGIDLGTNVAAEAGKNVLQAPNGQSPNAGAGICLDVSPNVGAVLMAQGNTFVSGTTKTDCSSGDAGTIVRNNNCKNGVSIGVLGPNTNTNQVVTLLCQQQ